MKLTSADSQELLKKIQESLKDTYPGVAISVEKDAAGPPAGYPINLELEGEDYGELIATAERNFETQFLAQKRGFTNKTAKIMIFTCALMKKTGIIPVLFSIKK